MKAWFIIMLAFCLLLLSGCNYITIKDSSNIEIYMEDGGYTRDGNTDAKLGLK